MKIEFKQLNESQITNLIKDFEVNSNLAVRIFNSSENIVVKLRNIKLEEIGRIFKIDNIELINLIEFSGESYKNLKYLSHEIYVHIPENKEISSVCEDLNITFKKVK